GIRDGHVTGVQTCALPIYSAANLAQTIPPDASEPGEIGGGVGRVAVVDHERASFHERVGNESPVPAVARVVSVVAEHEIILLWEIGRASCREREMMGCVGR